MIRILVVNDQKDSNYIFHALKQLGYEVKITQTSAECQEVIRTTEFDIIFIRLEPNKDLPLIFRIIKPVRSCLPAIGLTTLSGNKLNRLLESHDVSSSDFVAILNDPLNLETIIFVVEEIIERCQEEPIEKESPLSQKERQQRLFNRRRPLEDQRLSHFLSSNLKPDVFDE